MRPISPLGTPATDDGASCTYPGQREGFVAAVYEHHATALLRYGVRLTSGDWHRAEDFFQEAAVRAWKHFSATPTDPLTIRPWLFTVVRNLSIDHHRNRAIRPPETHTTDDLDIPVEDAVDRVLTTQIVLGALDELSPTHREVITLLHHHGYTVAQAAEHLNVPAGTVKSRSHYALRTLRTVLRARDVTHT
ncbi:sigma-70 family RNA polymerase sigma factor [Streptomyces bobili]|uniref:sigma-70 family RNA polymerase sigma factor n=1 Tax=Streptomyces bobili TaxID=67280 RepID=UPI003662CD06